MSYDWNFSIFAPYWPAFIRGIWLTIEISVVSAVAGTLAGVALGAIYRAIPARLQKLALIFNDVLRAIPILVLLFFFFFFPYQDFLGIKPLSPVTCSILALGLSQAVFTADLVYAAVERVSQRTIQGARSLGLRDTAIWRYIILPDIIRQILPTLIAFWIGILKLSNLASVIGVQEVVFVAQVASAQEFRSLEAWVIVAVIYVILVLPLTLAARGFEKSEWLKRRL
jgi:polar amino acid transport system permease protein